MIFILFFELKKNIHKFNAWSFNNLVSLGFFWPNRSFNAIVAILGNPKHKLHYIGRFSHNISA